MVRNSVGEECYVADEIITSRAGVRIRVGNTDAEVIFWIFTYLVSSLHSKGYANPAPFRVSRNLDECSTQKGRGNPAPLRVRHNFDKEFNKRLSESCVFESFAQP